MFDCHSITKSVLMHIYCHKCWLFSVGLPDPFSALLFPSLWLRRLTSTDLSSRLLGFSQWEIRQDVRRVEEREVWAITNWCSSSLCFSVVLSLTVASMTTISLGQSFVHSPSSQVSFKVVTITHCIRILQNPFTPISVNSRFSNNIPAESIICFLLWHWLIQMGKHSQDDAKWKQQGIKF